MKESVDKPKKISFFEFLASINEGPKSPSLFKNPDVNEKAYLPFMVNRGLSYFSDTVLLANEMNRRPATPPQAQYEFLRHAVRPRKRFSKWLKNDKSDDMELLQRVYKFSPEKARQALDVLSPETLAKIRAAANPGGK